MESMQGRHAWHHQHETVRVHARYSAGSGRVLHNAVQTKDGACHACAASKAKHLLAEADYSTLQAKGLCSLKQQKHETALSGAAELFTGQGNIF